MKKITATLVCMLALFACKKSDTQTKTIDQPKSTTNRTTINDTFVAQHDQLTYKGLATYHYDIDDVNFTSFDTAWPSIVVVTFIDSNFLQYKTISASYNKHIVPNISLDTIMSGLCSIGDTTYLGGGLRFKGKDSVFLALHHSSGCRENVTGGGPRIFETLKFSGKLTSWSHAH